MKREYDVAVVGGGIAGLAHAWMAARRRLGVVLLERSPLARGASVRNFGMIWPIGQPPGERYSLALRSRDLWLNLRDMGVLHVEECGSLHLVHRGDELSVLEEFCSAEEHQAQMVRPGEIVRRSPLANPDGLLGGMWSPTELRVDPRSAAARIAAWLSERHSVECCFGTFVTGIDGRQLHAAGGRQWRAERIVICSGSDLQTLYPQVMQHAELELCKLQMLRTTAQPNGQPGTPHIAGGLTLRHYASFAGCRSLDTLKSRIALESPELDRYGIHVMASQFPEGEVILGDSHEYGNAITPFDSMQIDELILRELHKLIRLSDWTIAQRWHGIYARHPKLPVFEVDADDGAHVFAGTGGAGMTLAFALAERSWNRWLGES